MTLEDFWKITLRHWALLLATAVVGLGLSVLYFSQQPKRYTAMTTAYVVAGAQGGTAESSQAQASMAYSNTMLAKQKAAAWLPLFKSKPVAERVAAKLHLKESPEALVSSIGTSVDQEAPVITVSVTSSAPRLARSIANEVVTSVQKQVEEIEGSGAGARVTLVSNAALPSTPSAPRAGRIFPIGLIIGLLVGYLIALVRHRQDTRVRSESDVEEKLGTSVLALIPESKGLGSDGREAESEDFRTREALRQLRTNLRFVDPDNPPRAILVTSSRMGEGKSSIASNLARVLAESGERVLLIDADLRRPMVSAILDLEPEVGLSQAITGVVPVAETIIPTTHRNMFAMPAGQIPPNPSELLGSKSMRRILEGLREEYFVILDAPPLLPVTDAALLLPSTDGALLVIEAKDTRKEQLEQALRNIQAVNGHLLGAVMNRVPMHKNSRYGYAKYAYGNQYGYEAYTTDSSSGKKPGRKESGANKLSHERHTSERHVPGANESAAQHAIVSSESVGVDGAGSAPDTVPSESRGANPVLSRRVRRQRENDQ